MSTVIGVDSSTQSCKVLAVDAQSGEVIASGAAAHPDLTAVDPHVWTSALREAWRSAGADRLGGSVAAAGIAAQQHGMVALDSSGTPVHDALLWNDTRSAADAARLRAELGPEAWVDAVNLVPVASFTISKLAWLAQNKPDCAGRASTRWSSPTTGSTVPWAGSSPRTGATPPAPATSPPSPTATGQTCWNASSDGSRAFRAWWHRTSRPAPCGTAGAWTGPSSRPAPGTTPQRRWDSACARARWWSRSAPHGTVFTSSPSPCRIPPAQSQDSRTPSRRPPGPAGHAEFRPGHGRDRHPCSASTWRTLDSLAQAAGSDAGGLTFLPYLDGERSPNLPHASGSLAGLTRRQHDARRISPAPPYWAC